MANEITAAVADAGLQEIWISEALEGLYEEKLVATEPVIWVQEVTGKKRGDTLDFVIFANSTVSAVGADGTLTNVAPTQTLVQVVLSRWRSVTWDVVDRVDLQSVFDYGVLAVREQTRLLGQDMDDAVLGNHTSFTGSNALGDVTAPGIMNIEMALESDVVLGNVPVADSMPKHWVFSKRANAQLFKNELLAAAQATGMSKGAQVTGELPTLLGYPIIKTSRVVSTGTPSVDKNFLLARHAIGLGISRDIKTDVFRTKKSNQYATDILYGQGVLRSNFAVTINTKSSA